MKKRTWLKAMGVSIGLLTTAGLLLSCGATIRPTVQEGYDWPKVNKICVIGISDLERSREISRALVHHLFERGFPVVRKDAESVLEIYDVAQKAGADVLAYGVVSKIEVTRSTTAYPPTTTKAVELELQFIETGTQSRIWKGTGSLADSANVRDEFIIQALLGSMVAEILPEWTGHPSAAEALQMLKVGDEAPLFEVPDVDGNLYALKDQLGKNVVVLSFWSFFCEPCKRALHVLNNIHQRYNLRGVNVAAVSLEGNPMLVRIKSHIYQERLEFTFLLDKPTEEAYEIADPYQVPGTPTVYVIGKAGKIAFARSGHVTFEDLSAVIESELAKD